MSQIVALAGEPAGHTLDADGYASGAFRERAIDAALIERVERYRLERLRQQMRHHGLDAVILFDPINIRYACGSRNMQVYSQRNPARYLYVAAEGPVVLFEFSACLHLARDLALLDDVRPARAVMPQYSGPHCARHTAAFVDDIRALFAQSATQGRRLGVESAPTGAFAALSEAGFAVSDAAVIMEGAKSVKSLDELALIHRSVTLTEAAMTRMEAALRPGMTENELWAIFNQHVLATGGEYAETRLLTSGARTNPWFQECSDKVIAPGELVAFDTDIVGCFGYYTDFSRTFHVPGAGAPSAAQKALYRMAADQLESNIALLGPGMSFREYSRRAWPIPEGYRENRYLDIVHGCGMTGEWPLIAHDMDWDDVGYDGAIEPGMTLCVEAYIGHRDGSEGVKLEEQVLITESGIDRLSTYGYADDLLD
ncbi:MULTISPECIES: M24 family metallopeptidase [Modicisalibacter]|uniref:Aminopeptidase P family protein n=1 Tax=Modicisalibacter tunisiensis TaxID=390637 RepID=A0ABS7WVP7_9GAMM|nr:MULTISPECIES: Xaa-Pro peptidase family protein [Modicisalibacter]MBZ9539930.1 aminopeptidase P family protein [Modicisalibacter tunisiensis]MBZ9566672.1 aminopeptidase P family protein [Modicisalibacter tunisiensis]